MYRGRKISLEVKRKENRASRILRICMIFFSVLFVLMGIVFSRGFMLPGFLMALMYLVYEIFSRRDYEYTLEDDLLSIDVIYGARYRKNKHELDLKDLEIIAPNWHEAVAKYRLKGGTIRLPKYDYTSYDDDVPYFTMIILEKGKKIKLLLDLDDEMLRAIQLKYPQKVILGPAG